MVVAAVTKAGFTLDQLDATERGDGGFGSTGGYHERDQTMLTDQQLERYARQVILPAFGEENRCCWASVMWPLLVPAGLVHR